MAKEKAKADPLVPAEYDGVFKVTGMQFRQGAKGEQIVVTLVAEWDPKEVARIGLLAGKVTACKMKQVIDPVLIDRFGRPMVEGDGDDGAPPTSDLFELPAARAR